MIYEVEKYLNDLERWQDELTRLRRIIIECGLAEDFKWKHPSYSINGKNILLIHKFKEYCAILFHKGALLNDPEKIHVQQTENIQIARQLRFTHTEQITVLEKRIKEYISEAVEIEKSKKRVEKKKISDYKTPEELKLKFAENPNVKKAFKGLTEGRQKGYLLHF